MTEEWDWKWTDLGFTLVFADIYYSSQK